MASSSSQVLIGIMVNLRGLVKLDQLNAALKQMKTNITAWQRAQSGANTTFGKFSQTANDAARSMKQMQQANAALATANTRLAQSQQRVQSNSQKLTNAQKETIRLRREEIRLDNLKIKSTDNLAARLRKVETAYDSIFRAGFRLQMLGNEMERLGQLAAGWLGGMAKEFGDFEFMINRAAGAMGILTDETDGGVNVYQKFQQQILKTSQELRLFKPEEVAKATYVWASTSGQQVDTLEDMERALRAVNPLMKIAALTQTDYETAIKGVYSIIVQYGKSIDDVQDVTEKLQKTTVETAAEFPDLINSFKMVGPIAAANNVTFEDMVDLFGKLADAGIRGSMSGRAFRQLFIQLVKPSELAKKALNELWASTKQFGGQSYTEMVFPQGEFIGVTKYVNLLATALGDLQSAERNALLARITTANELPVLTALVEREITALNTNEDAWSKGVKTQETAAQAFKRQWDILANSWNGLVGALERGVDTIQILIGQRIAAIFGPVVREITEQLKNLGNWFSNPQNQAIIDFFVKLASAATGLTLVTGFTIKFAGALVSLGAAFMVLVKSFGPFFAKIGAVGGVMTALVSAIQRNWDYIQDAIVSAWNDINIAFGGGEKAIESAGDAFNEFFAIVRPIFDFIVRTVADVIRSFGSLVKMIMSFAPAAAIIEGLGRALIFAFAAKTIANVLGLGTALAKFNLIGAKTVLVLAGLNKSSITTFASMGNLSKGASGLKGNFGSLLSSMARSPMILATIGIAIGALAYEYFPPFRQAIDQVVLAFKDWQKEADEVMASFGSFEADLETAISGTEAYAQALSNLAAAEARAAQDTGPIKLGFLFGDLDADTALKNAQDSFAQVRENLVHQFSVTFDILKTEMDTSLDEIARWSVAFQKAMNLERPDQGIPFAVAYLRAIDAAADKGTDTVDELRAQWKKLVDQGYDIRLDQFLKITLGPEGAAKAEVDKMVRQWMNLFKESTSGGEGFAGWTDQMRAELLAKIVDMRGQVSPEIQTQITGMLDDAVRTGFIDDDTLAAIEEAAGDAVDITSDALISAFEGIEDIDKQIAEAMKKKFQPKKFAIEVFSSYVSGAISQGFKDAQGRTNYAALLFAQEQVDRLGTSWQTAFDAMSPPDAQKFVRDTIRQFKLDFVNGVPDSVPPEMKDKLAEFLEIVYQAGYGEPVPQGILDMIYGKSVTAGEQVPAGVEEGVADPALNTTLSNTVTKMRDDTMQKLEAGQEPYNKGKDITDTYAEGILGGKPGLNTTVDGIRNSTKNISPSLGDVFAWGQHLVQKFLSGMRSIDVERIPNQIARDLSKPLKFSEPKVGPLRNMEESGRHYIQNFLSGMESMQRAAVSTSTSLADSLALNMGEFGPGDTAMTLDNRRVIKVQVEVTSPDGSVERIKTAQLQQALQTSDLILSLEHMATVS